MRKTVWALSISLLILAVIAAGCGAPEATPTTTSPPVTTSPTATTQSTTPPPSTTPTPASTPAPEETTPVLTFYESTEHGFSIEYPEGWIESIHRGATSAYFQFGNPEGSLSAGISLEYRAEEIGLEDAVTEGKEYLGTMEQYESFSEGYITTGNGLSCYELIGQGDEDVGVLKKHRYIILVRESQIFWVGVSGDPDSFDAQRHLVDTIIDSFILLPSYTYELPAPSPGGTYTSTEYGFSITYPVGWAECTTGQYSEILDIRADAGVPDIMIRTWTGATSAEDAALMLKQVYDENFPDYELLSEGEITLADGTPAYEFVFNATMQGYFLKAQCVTVTRGEDAFSIMGFGPPSTFTQYETVIDEIIGSFHLE
jgi:hypothetical protein